MPGNPIVLVDAAEYRQAPAVDLTGGGTCAAPGRSASLMVIEATSDRLHSGPDDRWRRRQCSPSVQTEGRDRRSTGSLSRSRSPVRASIPEESM
jgi:hypothetical protein